MQNICKNLCSYLRTLNFHFLDSWVAEYVSFYKSQNPDISLETLRNGIKEQWLLVNLRDIKVPSLPPDLISCDKTILNGTYAVQVETMIDSSRSCYSQLQQLRNIQLDEVEDTNEKEKRIPSRRCLTFSICDGVQELQAMEYQPITKILAQDCGLLPGFKMLIKGPVECRKGVILLKDENVQICGGKVDSMTITHSLKSVLMKKLNLNEDDCSENELSTKSESNKSKSDNTGRVMTSVENVSSVAKDNENADVLLSQDEELLFNLPFESDFFEQSSSHTDSIAQKSATATSTNYESEINTKNFTRDNIFDDLISMVNKKHGLSEEDTNTLSKKKISLDPELVNENSMVCKDDLAVQTSTNIKTDEFFIPDDDWESEIVESSKSNSGCLGGQNVKKTLQTDILSYLAKSDSHESLQSPNIPKTQVSKLFEIKPVIINPLPFVYLKDISCFNYKEPSLFTIKASILTLTKKITVENDEYNLKANITDGSLSVEAVFSSKILEDFLGFSPCEMAEMMKAKQTNSAVAQRIKEAFSKTQEKLISLNCLMDVVFYPDHRNPLILSLREVSAEHLNALKQRVT